MANVSAIGAREHLMTAGKGTSAFHARASGLADWSSRALGQNASAGFFDAVIDREISLYGAN